MRRTALYASCLIVLCCTSPLAAQQIAPRIAALADNEEYMSLLREDARLQFREDSIVRLAERTRRDYGTPPSDPEGYNRAVLSLENELFAIRTAKGRVVDKVNTIEQEWVIENLYTASQLAPPPADAAGARYQVPDSLQRPEVLYDTYLRAHLLPEDYAALQAARRAEGRIRTCLTQYFANYRAMEKLRDDYTAAQSEEQGIGLQEKFRAMQELNRAVTDSLAALWSDAFDSQNFAYTYLFDKTDRVDLLEREEQELEEALLQLAEEKDAYDSEAVTTWFIQRRLVLGMQRDLAEVLHLTGIRTAAEEELARHNATDYRLPPLRLAERNFLLYEAASFPPTNPYNWKNPIPECRVYARGTIYRLLLGTFQNKQSISIFRGVAPLYYLRDARGRWCYYAGGYESHEEALDAQALLKKRGFRRPEIVRWTDGEAVNLDRQTAAGGEGAERLYRIELHGAETLSEVTRVAVKAAAPDAELSKVGQTFVLGLFSEREEAERVAEQLRRTDTALEIKIDEIVE